eukprot:1893715-Rhodomonas_salina.1
MTGYSVTTSLTRRLGNSDPKLAGAGEEKEKEGEGGGEEDRGHRDRERAGRRERVCRVEEGERVRVGVVRERQGKRDASES